MQSLFLKKLSNTLCISKLFISQQKSPLLIERMFPLCYILIAIETKQEKTMHIIRKNKGVAILFILSILGIILSFCSYRNEIKNLEMRNFKKSLQEQTKIKLEITKDYISDMVYNLNRTTNTIQEYDSIWDPHVLEILDIANDINMFSFTAVVDKNGKGYTQNGTSFDISQEDYFHTAMNGIFAFSDVQRSELLPDKYLQIFACPMFSNGGQIRGIVLGVIDLDEFNKTIAFRYSKTNGNIYIIDSKGNYISRFQIQEDKSRYANFWDDLENFQIIDQDISDIKKDFKERKSGEFSFYDNNHRRYGCYMPIGTRNWQIVYTAQDTAVDEALGNFFRIDTKHTLFASICHLTWLLCVIWYFRKGTKEIKKNHQEVSENMEILHMALEHSKQPIFEYDHKNRHLTLKTSFPTPLFQEQNQNITPESIIEKNIIVPASIPAFMQLFKTIETQSSAKTDIKIKTENDTIWYRISVNNIYKRQKIINTVGFLEDITELKKMEQETIDKLELQDTLIAKALVYVKADMETNRLLEINGKEAILPFEEFLKTKVLPYVHTEYKPLISQELSLQTLTSKFKEGADSIETQFIINCKGQKKWVSCMAYCNTTNPSKIIFVISDIDKKKRQEIALQYQAERDGLTGLYNARTARTKIEEALDIGYHSKEKQVFILFDLDNYKLINDTFGHNFGDQVLVDVSEIVKKRFRSSDIIGRMGGDEFVILLRNMRSYQYAEKLISDLCEMINKTYSANGKEVTLSASIGITRVPIDGYTFEELYEKSDIALYQVKKHRKNNYKYFGDL